MRGKKDLIAGLMARTGLVRVLSSVHNALWHDLRVLAYHRVLPRTDLASFPFDADLISAWADEFDWQMAYLARHYAVITPSCLVTLLDAGKPVPRNAVMVTFDDGYRDNHDVALPILKRHDLRATLFVTTGYMDRDVVYWFDLLAYSTKHSEQTQLVLQPGETLALGTSMAQRQLVCERMLRHLKTLTNTERLSVIEGWLQALNVPAPHTQNSLHAPMSWDQVGELARQGMEIGSHTVNHPVLSTVADDAELAHELAASKADIEAHTGKPVVALAYPVGGSRAYDDRVIQAVRDAGYRFAFTYTAGLNSPRHWHPYRLHRSAVEHYTTRERFAAMLATPIAFV